MPSLPTTAKAHQPNVDHTLLHEIERAGPVGISVAQLLAQLPDLSRRTTQRWLAQLVDGGRITAIGEGRGRRYCVKPPALTISPSGFVSEPIFGQAGAILLAPDAQEVRHYVQQPITQRTPVGYQRELLEGYRPNRDFYLPAAARRQLHAQGQTPDAHEPAGTYSRAILGRLLIDLSWASSHMEGNTYSRLDTLHLIEEGTAAQGKARFETQMILNHKAAIELLVSAVSELHPGQPLYSRYLLMNVHAALAENLLPNPADEGRLRQHAVDIAHSVYRPLAAPQQVDELFNRILDKANAIEDPFEQAFFMLVHIPYLQPFADINKRVSRLAANTPLFRANLCPLTFVDVPVDAYTQAMLGIYEMGRVEMLRDLFLWAYERSTQQYTAISQTLAEPDPLRLQWRNLIKEAVRAVVQAPGTDAVGLVEQTIAAAGVPENERAELRALILDELRRLHEGVLARYGLRVGEWLAWVESQKT